MLPVRSERSALDKLLEFMYSHSDGSTLVLLAHGGTDAVCPALGAALQRCGLELPPGTIPVDLTHVARLVGCGVSGGTIGYRGHGIAGTEDLQIGDEHNLALYRSLASVTLSRCLLPHSHNWTHVWPLLHLLACHIVSSHVACAAIGVCMQIIVCLHIIRVNAY